MRERFAIAGPAIAAIVMTALAAFPAAAAAQTTEPVPSSTQAQPEVAGTADQIPEANAQSAPQVCDLSGPVNELDAVRSNASLGYLEAQRAETEARRKLLEAVIACDQREITALTEALESLPDDMKALPAYHRIVEGLANAAIFYSERKGGIPGMSIQNTKAASREISEWRERAYAPTVTLADNFILWADNQEFLDRASGRLAQVNRLVVSLKFVNQEDETAAKFEEAKQRLEEAFAENDRARDALNQGGAVEGLGHIQASLKALADTYDIFLGLQENLKKVVR